MKKILLPLILALLTACSGPKKFKVTIESESLGTQLLTVEYTLANGDRAMLQPTAMDGKVEFEGESAEPSLVEVFTTTGAPIVQFMAQNGEKISVRMTDGEWVVTGAAHALSEPIAGEDACSTFIAPKVIVERDSAETFPLAGVWVFTSTAEERTPALLDTLRHYGKRGRDIYLNSGYEDWRYATRRDSATWRQGLLPQGPVGLPAVTRTPLLIEVDTAGTIVRSIALGVQ